MADFAGLIEVQDLHREFHMGDQVVAALDGVSLTIAEGEFFSIMGPSGSGKSTLLYLLGGLDRPTEGTLRIRGQDITALDEDALAEYRRRDVGFVFQSFNLVSTMTALENVIFPTLFAGVSRTVRRQRARSLLERVGLGDRMDHRPVELSGGQQQRVAMARALVNDPAIILADEPTGNLDSRTGIEVLQLLSRLSQDEGRTVVIVSHDTRVSGFARRSVHLLDGKVVR